MKLKRSEKSNILILLILLFSLSLKAQHKNRIREKETLQLLDSLWENPTSFFNRNDQNWRELCENLDQIDLDQINNISQSVFYGKNSHILNHADVNTGALGKMNQRSHNKKEKVFSKKIRNGFRDKIKYPDHKVVLMEGDSWFEYPLFLRDITDHLMESDQLAVYSMASAGDWVSNMIAHHKYQFEYLKLKPDVFIISGGGNDILGDNRLASFVDQIPVEKKSDFLNNYSNYVVLRFNEKPVSMCNSSFCPIDYQNYEEMMPELKSNVDSMLVEHIVNGRRYLNKSYYRWLVSLKLEYKILIESIKKIDEKHFQSLMIITQGYDYAVPSFNERFGKSMFLKNGRWLKEPLMMKGITDQQTQEDIVMTMIFDFNEMLIELGKEFDNIYHIDSRGFTEYLEKQDHKKAGSYWFDELHPQSNVFEEISKTYESLILGHFKKQHKVVSVIAHHKMGNAY